MPTKIVNLSSEDIASVRRVLSHLDGVDQTCTAEAESADRLRSSAVRILELRQYRSELLNRAMLGEPAYEMLLQLYVSDGCNEPLTAARLADLVRVPHSSALRWIDYLASKELATRDPHPTDRRATAINLTAKGKEALERYLEVVEHAVIWRPVERSKELG